MASSYSDKVIISVGGSLIVPSGGIDTKFLSNLNKFIRSQLSKNKKRQFFLVAGGGRITRHYQTAAQKVIRHELTHEDLDWLGIYATRLNAQLIKSIFNKNAENFIVENPNSKINFNKNIIIACGWKPGWSTDYDAVLVAKNLGVKEVLNMSSVDYVYDKDPKKHKNARKIEKITWQDYSKLISNKWKAGMNVPFDPVAAKEAEKSKLRVCLIGRDLKNLENLLNGDKFRGTTIR